MQDIHTYMVMWAVDRFKRYEWAWQTSFGLIYRNWRD